MLAEGVANPPVAQASTESQLLAQLATKDSNGDGLPDWEKVLYGIPVDATTTDYFHLGMTDGEAVAKGLIVPKAIVDLPSATSTSETTVPLDPSLGPAPASGTLTDVFAKDFLTQYLNAKEQNGGQPLSQSQLNAIAQQTLSDLATAAQATPPFKSLSDLVVSGSGPAALRTFAASAEAVFAARQADASKGELAYLALALKGDSNANAHIVSIANRYRDTAEGLAALPVPQDLAQQDLALVDALMHMSGVVRDLTKAETDPVVTMLALQLYPQYVADLGNAFIGISNVYHAENVTLAAGAPGAEFVNLMSQIAAAQAASTTTL